MPLSRLIERDVILIVDDTPANLNLLTIALDQAGMVGLVALDGQMALEQLKLVRPSLILLDLIMPGMDGFELCRRLQDDEATRDIPVIFMTAMDDTEHVVRGFSGGAVDYVVKPIRPTEVVARIQAHLRRARDARQARSALEAIDRAAIALGPLGETLWLTEPATKLLARYYPECQTETGADRRLPEPLEAWIADVLGHTADARPSHTRVTADGRLEISLRRNPGEPGGVLLLAEESRAWPTETICQQLGLTVREAEILMWVAYGKTNRQIGEILGISPRTVNKHLDHVFLKLGVESRAAAAAIAIRNSQGGRPTQGGATASQPYA